MRRYVCRQTALLVRRLAAVWNRAARQPDAEAIHDLRVVLRRLSRCLRVFAPFYPAGPRKKIRRRIAAVMAAAGAVRDCDIAMELALAAGVAPRNPLIARLAARRKQNQEILLRRLRRSRDGDLDRQWRARLEL